MIQSERLSKRFLELTEIDSPSFGERKMADRLTTELKKLGFTVQEDDSGQGFNGNAGNIYAFLPGTIGVSPLLFSGHMDTVQPALGKKAQLHPDGTITSDGTTVLGADDAAGITAILEALTSIQEDKSIHRPLEILFTIAEEPYGCGSEVFDYSKVQSKEAYVLDLNGPIGGAAYAAPTICSFTAEFHGKAAHAGFAPEKGIHAIAIASEVISGLKMGYLDEQTTFNIGTIEGGTATNIVPDRCTIKGEIRSYSHATAENVLNSFVENLEKTAALQGATCKVSSRFGCYAYEVPLKHPVIKRYEEVCEKAGVTSTLYKTFGGSDANRFELNGIKSLVIASAMFNPHSCQEYTTVADLKKVAEIAESIMLSTF